MFADFTPTINAADASKQIHDHAKLANSVVFQALATEPNTGVGVVTSQGHILYINEQAARIFHGSDARACDFIGRFWHDHLPNEWTRERLRVLGLIGVSGKPVLMRTLWRDQQQFTWIYPIERASKDEGGDDDDMLPPDLFLTITRRLGSEAEAEELTPANSDIEEIESGVMRLKSLGSLSSREMQVIALLGQGLSMGEAARVLRLSEKTVDNYRTLIHHKLNVHDRASLVLIAARAGLSLADADCKRL
jgi:DNA-binding CsgD family transcriptional regulator